MSHANTSMTETNPTTEERERIWDRIRDLRFGVLTLVKSNGEMSARPLTNQEIQADAILYFVAADSEAGQLPPGTRVSVTYADPRDNFFVALSGTATARRDPDTAERLWSKLAEAWFPDGPTDPDLAVLRVDVSSVEYWDARSSRFVQFLLMAKAALTKTPPTGIGEHGTFRP